MNCRETAGLMSEYLDCCLGRRAAAELEAHVSACRSCAAELEEMRQMLACLRRLSSPGPPVDCWAGVKDRILAGSGMGQARWQWLLRPVVAAPAFAVVLLALALGIWPTTVREPAVAGLVSVPEYSRYIGAHSALQQQQVLVDRDVAFVTAELDKASLISDSGKP